MPDGYVVEVARAGISDRKALVEDSGRPARPAGR
jgi:hypothetical protein